MFSPSPTCYASTTQIWLCDGTVEIVPCSHVGRINRSADASKQADFSADWDKFRTASVWMDDYMKIYSRVTVLQGHTVPVSDQRRILHRSPPKLPVRLGCLLSFGGGLCNEEGIP